MKQLNETVKWRFKTREEFEATCQKSSYGGYKCGTNTFIEPMFDLCGKKYEGSPDNLVRVKNMWSVTPEMLMPIYTWKDKTVGNLKILKTQETIDGYWVVKVENAPNGTEIYLCNALGYNIGSVINNTNFDLLHTDPHFYRKVELKAEIEKLQKELNELEK